MALVEDLENTLPTMKLFEKVEQWLLQLVSEGKISRASLHNKVKRWTQLIRSKISQDQSVETQTLMVEKTSTRKENLRVSFSDVFTQSFSMTVRP